MVVLTAFGAAELRLGLEVVDILDAVLDEEGLFEVFELKLAHAAIHLGEHSLEDGVFFSVGAGGLRGARGGCGEAENGDRDSGGDASELSAVHLASFDAVGVGWSSAEPGMGRMGGRAVPCDCFCVSISNLDVI